MRCTPFLMMYGHQWMDWRRWLRSLDQQSSRHISTKDGNITTLLLLYFVFALMEPFLSITFMNLPGATHDSTIADLGGIYKKLEGVFRDYAIRCTVDSAFWVRDAPYLLKSSQNNITGDGETLEEIRHDIAIKRATASLMQSAEWGMGAIQASFPQLCDRLSCKKKGERRITLKMMILLSNMRARMVGINQIKNVFMPGLNLNAQLAFN